MAYIAAVGIGEPKVNVPQEKAKQLVVEIFRNKERRIRRLLPIFDNAKISSRQLATSLDWYKKKQSFATRNELYIKRSIELSLEAIDCCINHHLLSEKIPYEAIDLIVFVSSTGISTPSIDTYLINKRSFKEDIVRMPLWGLGCGGGAMGLSRAAEWLKLYPTKTALVICAELCSLTFQQDDLSTSNIVGTALFGDGVAATLLVGEQSTYVKNLPKNKLKIEEVNSLMQKKTLEIMGWNITNDGFEVVFSKEIPRLVQSIWQKHVEQFLSSMNIKKDELHCFVAHPGGRKVLEEMEKVFAEQANLFDHSYHVLKYHGNMSSATVLYVLKNYFEATTKTIHEEEKEWALLSALGPGFCSELLAMRWTDE